MDQQLNNMDISFKYKNYFNKNINQFLLKKGYSSNNIFYLIKNKNVLVNNHVVIDKNTRIRFNDTIKVTLNNEKNTFNIFDSKLKVLYEDSYILIVDKPKNMDVEPSMKNYNNTLANIVTNYYKNNNINSKIHLVNRLDKLTSGIVILAKNQYIHNLFKNVKIVKKYYCNVIGKPKNKGLIKIKIKKEDNSIKRVVDKDGKLCLTKYKLVSYKDNVSLLDIKLLTGRTHQIRLSFASINHPLVDDPLYGNNINNNMYLDAYFVRFKHPITKKIIKIFKNKKNIEYSCYE